MSATLFWKLSDRDNSNEIMQKNLSHIIKTRPALKNILNDPNDLVEQFLSLFFPDLETACYVANLSLSDKSAQKINLAIRIPGHPTFSEFIDEHSSFAVIGYWNTKTSSPWFTPEKIMITHNDSEPTEYEHEISCHYFKLGENDYPPRGTENVLTEQLANDLPKISVLTNDRLKDWCTFLDFKKRLIKQKTVGLRYLKAKYDMSQEALKVLVIAENEEELYRCYRTFARQNLQLFDLQVSADPWIFTLPDNDSKKSKKPDFELGQIFSPKSGHKKGQRRGVELLTSTELSAEQSSFDKVLKDLPFKKPILAWLMVSLTEDWQNKLSKVDRETEDIDELFEHKELVEDLMAKIPSQGFVSFSLIGDLALVWRQENTIKNLKQNENCYAPYLSSYLFDITKAQLPVDLPRVDEWYNNDLNEAQKSAVVKMIAAPDLCLIQGPPGTGKTTVIAEAILQFAKQGQNVLLASQAHDAIDNALSRIKNRPELRAIRLAKESKGRRSKITEEGLLFSGEQALARHYDALSQYVDNQYLKGLRTQKEQIETLSAWAEKAHFLLLDDQRLQRSIQDLVVEIQNSKEKLQKASRQFQDAEEQYLAEQQKKEIINSLIQALTHRVNFPNEMILHHLFNDLASALCDLDHVGIQLPVTFNEYQFSQNTQLACLISLLDIFEYFSNNIHIIQEDIKKLSQMGSGKLESVDIKLQIDVLNQEIDDLANQMDHDDSSELIDLWKSKRKDRTKLQQSTNGLESEIYRRFKDHQIFIAIDDVEKIIEILKERLKIFEQVSLKINTALGHTISRLKTEDEQLVMNQPSDENLQYLDREIKMSVAKNDEYRQKISALKVRQVEHLSLQNFSESDGFERSLTDTLNHIDYLKKQLQEYSESLKDWLPLFNQWNDLLNQEDQSIQDWNLIGGHYTEHCNLVAMSCNEDSRTLSNANLDGFDVVIIDEVSKATPLELLLPLMRGRKAILVGDHRQLPPLFQEGQDSDLTFEDMVEGVENDVLLTKENFKRYEKLVTASLFKEMFEKAPDILKERLTVQFRMHPDIMKMINYFYEGQLKCGNADANRHHHITLKSKHNHLITEKDHVLWVDTSYSEKGMPIIDSDSMNKEEAHLIALTLMNINDQMKTAGYSKRKQYKVGVVSFYQSQCRAIRDAIRKMNSGKLKFEAIDVEINTVIRYQGKEKPIILISLVRNDGKAKETRRSSNANVARFEFINVAMSRAQNLLMVFGARNMLEMRDIKLPKMDEQGSEKKKVYKDIFERLDRDARICTTKEFIEACAQYK